MVDVAEKKKSLSGTSYRDPGDPIIEQAIPQAYHDIRRRAGGTKKIDGVETSTPLEDDTKKFAEVAFLSGTHILKIHNKEAQDHVLRFPNPITGKFGRLFPSMNAARGKYAGVIFQPIAVLGHPGAMSLVDHILNPVQVSEKIKSSFAEAFSEDSLEAIEKALLEPRFAVKTLYAGKETNSGNLPVIFVPGPDGQDLQLTPISPLENFSRFKSEVIPEKGAKMPFRTTDQMISSQTQNISTALGGSRKRFMANVPMPLARGHAEITRLVLSAKEPDRQRRMPLPRISGLNGRMEQLINLHQAKKTSQLDGGYFNANMERGLRRLGAWIIGDFIEWRESIEEAAIAMDHEFTLPEHDPVSLLVRSYFPASKNFSEDRAKARQAMLDATFQKTLEKANA